MNNIPLIISNIIPDNCVVVCDSEGIVHMMNLETGKSISYNLDDKVQLYWLSAMYLDKTSISNKDI